MSTALVEPVPVVSPGIYALILDSPRLREQLLPEGLITSPYTVLSYDMTLVLGDKKGSQAVFRRRQRIQFQQDGVVAILDHFWGDGVTVAEYATSAGQIRDSFKDGKRRHLVIELKRPMRRGEVLNFTVERRAMEAFTADEEWEETTIDHPIQRLGRVILFPKDRPCESARLEYQGREFPLHVLERRDGTTQIGLRISQARANVPYIVRWTW